MHFQFTDGVLCGKLRHDFYQIYHDKKYTDCILCINATIKIYVHKALLCSRSSYFKKLLLDYSNEKMIKQQQQQQQQIIDDDDDHNYTIIMIPHQDISSKSLIYFIQYLYYENHDISEMKICFELFDFHRYYQLTGNLLARYCQLSLQHFLKHISMEQFISLLHDLYQSNDNNNLTQRIMYFMIRSTIQNYGYLNDIIRYINDLNLIKFIIHAKAESELLIQKRYDIVNQEIKEIYDQKENVIHRNDLKISLSDDDENISTRVENPPLNIPKKIIYPTRHLCYSLISATKRFLGFDTIDKIKACNTLKENEELKLIKQVKTKLLHSEYSEMCFDENENHIVDISLISKQEYDEYYKFPFIKRSDLPFSWSDDNDDDW